MAKVPGRILQLLAAIPRFLLLLLRLVADSRVSGADKALLGGAILYALSPLDLLPDFIPVLGQLDDLYLIALAIDRLIRHTDLEIVRSHWDGPDYILDSLRGSLGRVARFLPTGVQRELDRKAEES